MQVSLDALRLGSRNPGRLGFGFEFEKLRARVVSAAALEDIRRNRHGGLIRAVVARLRADGVRLEGDLIEFKSPAAVALTRGTPAANACLAELLAAMPGADDGGCTGNLYMLPMQLLPSALEPPPLPQALACLLVLEGPGGQPKPHIRRALLTRLTSKRFCDSVPTPDLVDLLRAQPLVSLVTPLEDGCSVFERMATLNPLVALDIIRRGFDPSRYRWGLADLVVRLLLSLDAGLHQDAIKAVGLQGDLLHACRAAHEPAADVLGVLVERMACMGDDIGGGRVEDALFTLLMAPGWSGTVRRLEWNRREAPPIDPVAYAREFYQHDHIQTHRWRSDVSEVALDMVQCESRLDRAMTVVRRWSPLRAAWVGAVVKGVWAHGML